MFKRKVEPSVSPKEFNDSVLKSNLADEELDKRLKIVEQAIKIVEQEVYEIKKALEIELGKLKNEIDTKFIGFHKEVTDKYFGSLEKIIRFNKEISLIDQLANSIKDKDLVNLKQMLMEPILKARWAEKEKETGENIDKVVKTQGQRLVDLRKELHDEMIVKERQSQSVASQKAKIELIDSIIGGKL